MIPIAEFSGIAQQGREARVAALMARAVRGSRYRCMRLSIDDNRVRLTVPASLSDERLRRFLIERDDWIVRHVGERARREPLTEFSDGGRFLWRGRMMRIETTAARADLRVSEYETDEAAGVVCFALPEIPAGKMRDDLIARLVRQLLRRDFVKLFEERTEPIVRATGLLPKKIAVSNAVTRWGSCSAEGVVRLSWRLACLNPRLYDYVLVHELMHLKEMNHSPAFWGLVQAHCPQYRERRAELKQFSIAALA